ncbi:MAG: hypothetical protein QNJ13_16855 [Paracoccaceae bacterium]|nr:hypothetical protein [Paracoccaceae bacterium]
MDAILRRLPDADYFHRNRARFGGFLAGAVGTLMAGLLIAVIYQGYGFGQTPPQPETVVYPNW